MSDKINAPFTEEQVRQLNESQEKSYMHPYTCMSYNGCKRSEQTNEGTLIATIEGWVCPCGKYKQNWAHDFSLKIIEPPVFFKESN